MTAAPPCLPSRAGIILIRQWWRRLWCGHWDVDYLAGEPCRCGWWPR